MKFTMFVTQEAMQFNLEPESETEKELLKLLNKYKGEVTIQNGADIGMSQAGYIRSFDRNSDRHLAIIIKNPTVSDSE